MYMSNEIEEFDQERIDAIIWRYADVKSTKEIAQITGLSPGAVLSRKREIYDSIDELSIQQKRQRLIIELEGMSRDARDRAEKASDEFYAGTLNASVGAIKALLVELARMEKQDDSKVAALNQLRLKELLRLVDTTVKKTFNEIASVHNLDQAELLDTFQEHLMVAAREMDAE